MDTDDPNERRTDVPGDDDPAIDRALRDLARAEAELAVPERLKALAQTLESLRRKRGPLR